MEHGDLRIFRMLFKAACLKCFGHALEQSLSETESKQLSTTIFERTGLVIGVKSIKNYSQFLLGSGREENPSVATLDTLARYVMDAPAIDEVARKDREPHHPYWFEYKRAQHLAAGKGVDETVVPRKTSSSRSAWIVGTLSLLGAMTVIAYYAFQKTPLHGLTEDFTSVDDKSLAEHGWILLSKHAAWWDQRTAKKGHLTLYTLTGDNWSDSLHQASISNLLVKEIDASCFTTEIHFSKFVPEHNWQQAGLLLLEDTLPSSRGIRLSIAYNDFFGGYEQASEILIQAISSFEYGGFQKPEEFAHIPIIRIDPLQKALTENNLASSALRIEKSGSRFRFLYSNGSMQNAAFKEAAVRDFNVIPRYIGIFAIQGFVNNDNVMPVFIDKFMLNPIECE